MIYAVHAVVNVMSLDSLRWILCILLCYAAAAVCRDFTVTALMKKILHIIAFSNWQDFFITIKSCLGIFWPDFEKQDGRHRRFF